MSGHQEATSKSVTLYENPFSVLGATTRDGAQRIIDLADEKSLLLDDEVCRKARSDLTTPRLRLAAEMGWLPGISPGRADELIFALQGHSLEAADDPGLPTLVRVNLMAAAFQCEGATAADDFARLQTNEAAGFILKFSYLIEAIDAEEVLRDINEDRAVAGFPEVRGTEPIDAELTELKRQYRNIVKEGLNRMPPSVLIETMAEAVREDTSHGETQASTFLDELVDIYEEETKGFLEDEIEKISKLLDNIRSVANLGTVASSSVISKLEEAAKNWIKVAEPIQLSLKSRGIEHDLSNRIAYQIRQLSVDLLNDHGMLDKAAQINALLQNWFAYVPEVAARLDEDADAIRHIAEARKKAEQELAEWQEAITYRTEVGLFFKAKLAISPNGIEWREKRFPLASITRVRWGGVKHSTNGIPTGTNYTIALGDNHSEVVISLRDGEKYEAFLKSLWQAVCVRLMGDIVLTLRNGEELRFGDALVTDLGVTLTKHKWLAANEKVFCDWWAIKVWSANGSFYIGSKSDNKTYSTMSYVQTPNAHLLEQLIRMSFKNQGKTLSGLLNEQ